MSTKHFDEELARAFLRERPAGNSDADKRLMWNQQLRAVGDVCVDNNPRFSRSRFEKAAGGLFDNV